MADKIYKQFNGNWSDYKDLLQRIINPLIPEGISIEVDDIFDIKINLCEDLGKAFEDSTGLDYQKEGNHTIINWKNSLSMYNDYKSLPTWDSVTITSKYKRYKKLAEKLENMINGYFCDFDMDP